MTPIRRFTPALALLLVLSACGGGQPTPVAPAEFATPTGEAPLPTVTTAPQEVPPTATVPPTEVPRDFVVYEHPTGVFALTVPDDWEALNESTERRLRVRFLPPPGFGSRVIAEVTNTGATTPEAINAQFEAVILQQYTEDPAYTEVSREQGEDGSLRAVFVYDDGTGGRGRERLITRQDGPYFTVLRVFLAERDSFALSSALDTVATSLSVDTAVTWGSPAAAINPAELVPIGTLLWRDSEGITHYTGQIRNDAPVPVTDVTIAATLCDENALVLTEVSSGPDVTRIRQGAAVPFALRAENLPEGVELCGVEVTASPATLDPGLTNALEVESSLAPGGGDLLVSGIVNNPTLAPVTGVQIVFAVYDAQDRVIAYQVLDLGFDVVLQPGETLPFEGVITEQGGTAARYIVLNQATVLRSPNPSLAP